MKHYLVVLVLFCYAISVCLSCKKGESSEWSGVTCNCNGTHYICDKIPTKAIDYQTCSDKVIKFACGDCICDNTSKKYLCKDLKCNPDPEFGKPGYCIPNSLLGESLECTCLPDGNQHFCKD